jgi:hypothetical protein
MDRVAFGLGQLDRLANYFPRVEGKAAALFAIDAAMLGIVALNFPFDGIQFLASGFGGAAALVISLSLWQLYYVFFPDTKRGATHSMLYFGDIANGTFAEYEALLANLTSDKILVDLACQIHRNAEILAEKYARIQAASVFTAFGLVAWLVFLAALAFAGIDVKWGA